MARFSSRGRDNSSEERSERSEGSSRGSFRRGGGESRSSSRSSGSYSKGGKKDGPSFIRVGNITPTKSTDRDTVKDLRGSDIKLWWKVYLPKGAGETLTLRQGDRVMIQLGRVHKDAEHFVVGNISLPPESDGEGSEE